MAINETSVDGKKYRQKTTDGWKWYSFITKAKDILFGDGDDANNNLETNLGSFKGITTSTNVTEAGYAADATVVSQLNNSLHCNGNSAISTESKTIELSGTTTLTTPSGCSSVKVERVSGTSGISATVTVNNESMSISGSSAFSKTVSCSSNQTITIVSTRNNSTDNMVLKFTYYGGAETTFYFDYKDGKYGFNTSPNRGADTFNPFSEELVEQTVTQSVTYNNTNEIKVTFTFNNLKEVIGVNAFSCNKSGTYFYIVPASTRPFVISGNTVTVYVVLYNGSASYSITAIGYAN